MMHMYYTYILTLIYAISVQINLIYNLFVGLFSLFSFIHY